MGVVLIGATIRTTIRTRRPGPFITAIVMAVMVGCAAAPPEPAPSFTPIATVAPEPSATASETPAPSADEPAVLLAAGDIASCDWSGDEETAALLTRDPDATIAVLGDLVYPAGSRDRYEKCYGAGWGQFLDRTRPAIGNHDLQDDAGDAYWDLFGSRAGAEGSGWYSYELGAWHVVVLNSHCDRIGCEAGSAQHEWLLADLAAADRSCILAYWHHPRFTSGPHGPDPRVDPLWTALADAGADLVLVGHDHHYERFAPMAADGSPDPAGVRQFIVGTGGAPLRTAGEPAPHSELIIDDRLGILRLELATGAYAWSFLTVDGSEADAGEGSCED